MNACQLSLKKQRVACDGDERKYFLHLDNNTWNNKLNPMETDFLFVNIKRNWVIHQIAGAWDMMLECLASVSSGKEMDFPLLAYFQGMIHGWSLSEMFHWASIAWGEQLGWAWGLDPLPWGRLRVSSCWQRPGRKILLCCSHLWREKGRTFTLSALGRRQRCWGQVTVNNGGVKRYSWLLS